MSSSREIAIAAVKRALNNAGDNLYRAQCAFSSCTPKQMRKRYGASKDTRQQILDGYQERYNVTEDALEWLETLDKPS